VIYGTRNWIEFTGISCGWHQVSAKSPDPWACLWARTNQKSANSHCIELWHKLQRFLVNKFCLISTNAYPHVFCVQIWKTWSCDNVLVVFIPLWKLNLLHMYLNVTQPFCYAYHSTRKYVLYMYETIIVGNGRQFPVLLNRRMHGVSQRRRRRKTFRVSKEFSVVCS
jgi:hypothetical protein